MSRSSLFVASLALLLAGVAHAAAVRAAEPARSDLPIKEFMAHVFERNAEQVWAWTAEEIDATGEHSSRPRTEQEWEYAESDALSVRELSFALEGSSNRIDDPAWRAGLARVRDASSQSAVAAEAHDYPALLKAADALNAACVACHMHFAPQLEGPPPSAP